MYIIVKIGTSSIQMRRDFGVRHVYIKLKTVQVQLTKTIDEKPHNKNSIITF